jgi:membrane associated rhomboid family serine protease
VYKRAISTEGNRRPVRTREPIFNAPGVVVGLLGVFVAMHVVRVFVLSDEQAALLIDVMAFIPARLSGRVVDPYAGAWVKFTQFFTHTLVHGDWAHLGINSAWFLAFGSPVARRTGILGFVVFFVLCGIGGALFFYVLQPDLQNSMVGASGAISGLMGAAFRFMFRALSDGDADGLSGNGRQAPLESLASTLTNRRILIAVAGWTLLNVVFAWAAGYMDAVNIAWEAHLGGFYMGILTFGLFDRPPTQHFVHQDAA